MKNLFTVIITTLMLSSCCNNIIVEVENETAIDRTNESVEVCWCKINDKLKDATAQNVIVLDNNGNQITSQLLYNGTYTPTALLFQATVAANSTKNYKITTGVRDSYDTLTFGRFVPERYDDFAWENNQIAYRMYGPALEATGEISSGIDIWVKRTPNLVINKWYKPGVNYHEDFGEGLDCYKVGPTLGCGSTAPIIGDSLVMSNNYTSYKILDCGPLRTSFELSYAPFSVDGKEVTQTRIISLDANTNLNNIVTTYSGDFDKLEVATGIVIRNEDGEKYQMKDNYLAYQEPESSVNGILYGIVVMDGGKNKQIKEHIVKTTTLKPNEKLEYKTGGYWSKFGIENYQDFISKTEKEAVIFDEPLEVDID